MASILLGIGCRMNSPMTTLVPGASGAHRDDRSGRIFCALKEGRHAIVRPIRRRASRVLDVQDALLIVSHGGQRYISRK